MAVAPHVIDVFPCRVGFTQQVQQGVILVVLHDAQ